MRVWVVYEVNSRKIIAVVGSEEAAYRKAGESRSYTYEGAGYEVENAHQ